MNRTETFDDLVDLFRRYIRQETLEPLQSLGRFLLFGTAGSVLVGVGMVLMAVGGLRGLQAWGPLDGWWSWVPYITVALSLALAGLVVNSRTGKSGSSRG